MDILAHESFQLEAEMSEPSWSCLHRVDRVCAELVVAALKMP